MEPTCTAADLALLAEMCRAEGVSSGVEDGASRVRLPGSCYARPDKDGQLLGWAESDEVLWYGRFDSVAELIRSARNVRRMRRTAKIGLGLIGLWFIHVAAAAALPGYRSLIEEAGLINGVLLLCALLGVTGWLTARVLRWRLMRRARGVVWLRGPLESANRTPR